MSDADERAATERVARDLTNLPQNWSTADLRRRIAAVQSEYNRGAFDGWTRVEIDNVLRSVDALRRQRGDRARRQTLGAKVSGGMVTTVVFPAAMKLGMAALAITGLAAAPPLLAALVVYLRGSENREAADELKLLADSLRKLCETKGAPPKPL